MAIIVSMKTIKVWGFIGGEGLWVSLLPNPLLLFQTLSHYMLTVIPKQLKRFQ